MALENVVSFGTEGRRPDEEVPASDNVYDYIVFRGSDVKDLRIEEPEENVAPKPPQIPDDPAILGVSNVGDAKGASLFERIKYCVMKYFGCKPLDVLRERKTVWRFPLPSF